MSLWTTEHAPESLDEIPQDDARDLLEKVAEGRLNAVLHGPAGVGKTAAVRALAHEEFGDEGHLFVLNASDFFGMTKDEISKDPRFRRFISSKRKRESSKADMINHVLKEIASHPTVDDGEKLVLIDNAEEMRRDFQQALRRVMERYSDTSQFVLTTRSLSSIIPAIRSRCLPVPFGRPSKDAVVGVLSRIADSEGVEYDAEGLDYLAEDADGNLREAVLLLQTAALRGDVTMGTVYEVDSANSDTVSEMLELAHTGEFDDAVELLDELMIDEGYSAGDLLETALGESRGYDDERAARTVELLGDVDAEMSEGANERIHLERLLSSLG